MKEALPAIDEQIKFLEEQVNLMKSFNLTPENLKDLFVAKDPVIQKL